MKNKALFRILASVLVLILGLGCLAGCGSSKSASGGYYQEGSDNGYAYDGAEYELADYALAEAPVSTENKVASGDRKAASGGSTAPSSGGSGVNVGVPANSNLKLIYRADISAQTLDFDKAVEDLNGMVAHYGGYFESANVDHGSYYSGDTYMRGYYTVRIPADHYQDFVSEIGGICHINNINQSVEDVGLQYADIESRLQTLRTKHDRLIELLEKATEMTDIIELENALSDCEAQIDSYGSRLNRYDSLIGYSTITITLTKVNKVDDTIEQDNSFFARLARNFRRGLDNVGYTLEEFAFWLSYNLIGIIVFVLVAWLIIRYLKKRPMKLQRKKKEAPVVEEVKVEEKKAE